MQNEATLTDANRAYERIKDMIVTLEMSPGAVIQEHLLKEQLDLGRTPIREALKRLEAENLVIIKPRRGIFVADITITDLTQIYEVRIELETLCARLAAHRATPSFINRMEALVDEYQTIPEIDLPALFAIDRKFHITLADATLNSFLSRELALFYNLSMRIWYLALSSIQSLDIDVAAHPNILAAIKRHDTDLAEERMREHIRHFHQAIRKNL
jgi:DNA-binding GntR family transcriptional regulator